MSYSRIEGAFQTFKGKKELRAADFAVLLALSYYENDKDGRCFPSIRELSESSHVCERSVSEACKHLKKLNCIDYTSGGYRDGRNFSTTYSFKFSKIIRGSKSGPIYQPVADVNGVNVNGDVTAGGGAGDAGRYGTVCIPVVQETQPRVAGDAGARGTVCRGVVQEMPTNKESNNQFNKEKTKNLTSVSNRGGAGGGAHTIGDCLTVIAEGGLRAFVEDRKPGLLERVMHLANADVHDVENKKAFTRLILLKDKRRLEDKLHELEAMDRQGELDHPKGQPIRNRAAYITECIKRDVPDAKR